ncbi:MAG: DedA family protein [bacterium]|nr:DedA family protein [Candidatus Jorgensenbacteria bacterium]
MSGLTTSAILALIIKYKYLIIFPIAVLEGPLISMAVGFLIYSGYLNAFFAFTLLILADLVGDSLYYSIGRFGRKTFIHKYGRYIGINEERVLKLETQFEHHHWKIIAVGKTQAVGSLILVAAGIANAPFKKFLWYNLLGTVPKTLIFVFIGYFFSHGFEAITSFSNSIGIISIGMSVALLIFYIVFKMYLKKKSHLNGQ